MKTFKTLPRKSKCSNRLINVILLEYIFHAWVTRSTCQKQFVGAMSRKHSRRRKKASAHGRAQLVVPEISALGDPNKLLKKSFPLVLSLRATSCPLEIISSKSGQQDSRAQHSTMTTDFITFPKRAHRQCFVCLTSCTDGHWWGHAAGQAPSLCCLPIPVAEMLDIMHY